MITNRSVRNIEHLLFPSWYLLLCEYYSLLPNRYCHSPLQVKQMYTLPVGAEKVIIIHLVGATFIMAKSKWFAVTNAETPHRSMPMWWETDGWL